MINQKKLARMAGLAFENALRLHEDAILLFINDRVPSAYQQSVLAQEEIGKVFMLEEIIFRRGSKEISDENEKNMLTALLSNHRVKQQWFTRQIDGLVIKRRGKYIYSRFGREAYEGSLDARKMNSIYVGLSRNGSKINFKGKIISPIKLSKAEAKRQITHINDFIIMLAEGCMRGGRSMDTYEVDSLFTLELVSKLEELWAYKARGVENQLKRLRKYPILTDEERY